MNTLDLPIKYEGRVRLCFDIIDKLMPASEVYLFGSYATNSMNGTSKVGILVLVGEENSFRELQRLKWEVEEMLYTINDEVFEMDLRIFPKPFYVSYLHRAAKLKETAHNRRDLRQVKWR